jgi:hypothetical protein
VPTEEELRRTRAAIAKKVLTRNYSDVILICVYVAFALISYLATPSMSLGELAAPPPVLQPTATTNGTSASKQRG